MNILGHLDARELLFAADKNRAHSFLLEGPRGIGKAMLAHNFAGHILGNHEKVHARSHPDFLVIERRFDEKAEKHKKEIVVDDARKLGSFLALTPAESENRIAIVDSADELNTQAANALLKLVEEPPKRAIIILLSHGGHVLPTIRSRCVSVRFKPLSIRDMRQVLQNTISGISENDMDFLSEIADGSPGVAKSLYENDGLYIAAELIEILEAYPRTEYTKIVKFAERIIKSPEGWDTFCFIFDLLLTKVAKAAATGTSIKLGEHRFTPDMNVHILLDEIAKWQQLRSGTEIFNLDKKQVIVQLLDGFSVATA